MTADDGAQLDQGTVDTGPEQVVSGDHRAQLCRCGHARRVHGGHDGLARCALRSCYCGAFTLITSPSDVVRVSEWDTPPAADGPIRYTFSDGVSVVTFGDGDATDVYGEE